MTKLASSGTATRDAPETVAEELLGPVGEEDEADRHPEDRGFPPSQPVACTLYCSFSIATRSLLVLVST